MTTLRKLFHRIFNKEAALAIGGFFTAAAFVIGEVTGAGIWVEGDLMATFLNTLPKLGFLAAGFATRYGVYSKQTTAKLVGVTPTELAKIEAPP